MLTLVPPVLLTQGARPRLLRCERMHRLGNYRESDEWCVLRIVVNRLLSRLHGGINAERVPCIRVPIIMREVAARYLKPDLVAGEKNVARWPDVDDVFVDLPWHDQRGVLK